MPPFHGDLLKTMKVLCKSKELLKHLHFWSYFSPSPPFYPFLLPISLPLFFYLFNYFFVHSLHFLFGVCHHDLLLTLAFSEAHGLINYIDNKAKCRYLKTLTCKGTLRQVFIRIYRLETGSTLHPVPPLPCVNVQYIQTVCGWERMEVLSPVEYHILQEFNTLYLTRFRTYKIARPPLTKT